MSTSHNTKTGTIFGLLQRVQETGTIFGLLQRVQERNITFWGQRVYLFTTPDNDQITNTEWC